MNKTITSVTPPLEGTKRPGIVKFEDGTFAKYWVNSKWGSPLEPGQTAECITETKDGQNGPEIFLKQWGAAVFAGRGGGAPMGRAGMSPEERRSIAIQASIKAACELFHGSGDMAGAAKAVTGLVKLHDHLMVTKPEGVE